MAKPATAEQKAAAAEQRRVEQALEREKAARAKASLGGLWVFFSPLRHLRDVEEAPAGAGSG